jgi:hypothetical protein
LSALPGRFRQDLADRLLEAGMVVADDDELYAGETAGLSAPRESRGSSTGSPVRIDKRVFY